MKMTTAIARAAAQDAANKRMRKEGRTAWNADDYDYAARLFSVLLAAIDD